MGILSRFGFSFAKTKEDKAQEKRKSFIQPTPEDGSIVVEGVGEFGSSTFDISGSIRSEIDLINKYREMELQAEVNRAIDDVVNEAIVIDNDHKAISINLDRLTVSDNIKSLIRDEFEYCLNLLDFQNQAYEIMRRFYVDGRLYFHAIVDKDNPSKGVEEIRYIDPRQIKKVLETKSETDSQSGVQIDYITDEYFIYTRRNLRDSRRNAFGTNFFPVSSINLGSPANMFGVKISKDSVLFTHSGRVNETNNTILSHLHPAIRFFNLLRKMEDAVVIYRLTRAPERRIFYIDTGNLPRNKAEEYLRSVMEKYKNKLQYDASTGEIRDDRRWLAMTEDFWLPRKEGSAGTEITTLPGGQNLGAIEDVEYFQKKLYQALNVPQSRLQSDNGFNMGRSSEISNEELRFYKFIQRLRNRFTGLFDSFLEKQLVLKNIINKEEWQSIKENIQYDFNKDSYFTELKDFELLTEKLNIMDRLEGKIGVYFSKEYVQKKILGMDDHEIEIMNKQIEKEKKTGEIINNTDVEDENENEEESNEDKE
jgi:hypothetical protein